MLVKFLPTRVEGTSINVVLNYLFQKKDASGKPREVVRQVAGTMPELLSLMCIEVPSKNPFSHSVVTFSDGDMASTTELQRLEILQSYIRELSAGLGDSKRMPFIAVDHGNHFHILCLRTDLLTDLIYQPFVKIRGDVLRMNSWKDLMCAVYGLEQPSASGSLFRLSVKHAPEEIRTLVKTLNEAGADVMQERGEIEPQALLQELEPVIRGEGFEVARVIKSGFSVTTPAMKRNIRIKFTERALGKPERVMGEDVDELKERLACCREKLMAHMGRYHQGNVPEVMVGLDSTFQGYYANSKSANEVHPLAVAAYQ